MNGVLSLRNERQKEIFRVILENAKTKEQMSKFLVTSWSDYEQDGRELSRQISIEKGTYWFARRYECQALFWDVNGRDYRIEVLRNIKY
jgi:hypothetical protein